RRFVGERDVGPNVANPAVLDEDVGLREVPDPTVEGEHDAAFEQNAPPALQASEVRTGTGAVLRAGPVGKARRSADCKAAARFEKGTTGGGAICSGKNLVAGRLGCRSLRRIALVAHDVHLVRDGGGGLTSLALQPSVHRLEAPRFHGATTDHFAVFRKNAIRS